MTMHAIRLHAFGPAENLRYGEVTVALDGVGGKPGRDALDLLGVGGRLVLFG